MTQNFKKKIYEKLNQFNINNNINNNNENQPEEKKEEKDNKFNEFVKNENDFFFGENSFLNFSKKNSQFVSDNQMTQMKIILRIFLILIYINNIMINMTSKISLNVNEIEQMAI